MTGGRARSPLWLAQPTRFAGWPRQRARIALAVLALLLVFSFTTLVAAGPPPVDPKAPASENRADVLLYESIVDSVRHGGDYYLVTAQALRTGNYPLRPFVTFRLPTLALVQAHFPPAIVPLLLYALVIVVGVAWWERLRRAMARWQPVVIAVLLLAGGMAVCVQPELIVFHEIWAGLLIALSVGLWRPGRWIESVAFGLAAMLIRETAALYVGAMFVLALTNGDRREALGWFIATTIFAVAVAAHAHAVGAVVRPFDPASPGWSGMLGVGFFIRTMALSTALTMLPLALAAPLVVLAVAGWAGWRDPFAGRMLATLLAYAALIACFCRADTFYWGLLAAPLLLTGLIFVPDSLRDLLAAALDTRRITVTRVVR